MSHQPRVLVAEPSAPLANALRKFLAGWADVQVVQFVDEAVQLVRARPPDVLIAAVSPTFDGETLAPQVRKQAPETAIILAYPAADAERAPERARKLGVESFLVGPLKKHQVLAVVQAVARLNGLAAQLRGLQAKFEELKAVSARQALKPKPTVVGVNAPDQAFFKKYMLLEVKRSKRYQYPVALMLVSFDRLGDHLGEAAPEFQKAAIRAEALEALSQLLRDIDVAMPFGDEKYLLFLPHTPLRGSTIVAGRVVERLSKLDSFPQGTVSVGVASFDPKVKEKEQVSFGGLVREANEALQRAQAAGGNRFEAPELPAAPKRSRISLG
ncbi:MAG: diguanylate cyclase domain-containing protein [Myxococcota bacterium]